MDAQTIAEALNGKRYGKGYRSACPVCGGSDKSTKFTMTDTGDRTLIYCFSGCSFIELVTELRSRGLWPDSTPEQKQEWLRKQAHVKAGEASIYQMVAESAIENGETLSRRERRKLFVARKIVEAANG
jgi:hypothetical protein